MRIGSKPGHGVGQIPPRFARKRTRMSKLGSPITLEWSLIYRLQAVHSSLHHCRLLCTEGLVLSSCYAALTALACLQPCHAFEVVLAPAWQTGHFTVVAWHRIWCALSTLHCSVFKTLNVSGTSGRLTFGSLLLLACCLVLCAPQS